jgi:metal-responsive CopG/Arc/MetJ family transcriptional regulator
MKAKTSITLSQDLLREIDRLAGSAGNRSALIERVLRAFVKRQRRLEADARDLDLLNKHAARLNAEAADVGSYQASWPESTE